MPAIQPARLKKQIVELVSKVNQPASFVGQLRALLSLYTDHTQRPGQAGIPTPLQDSYNAPPPVMRQVWHALTRTITLNPEEILQLCDALWAEQNYDLQLLAARLLGQLPAIPPSPMVDRLQAWVHSDPEKRLLDGLLEYSLVRFHQDAPDQLLELVSSWLASPDLPARRAGLRALLALIDKSGVASLPAIFHLVTPYLRVAHPRLRPDIIAVTAALAKCSPAETAYLLRQNISAPDNPDTPWIIRQVLDEFPEETKSGLRSALKDSAEMLKGNHPTG